MFSAEYSWDGQRAESYGERRERKEQRSSRRGSMISDVSSSTGSESLWKKSAKSIRSAKPLKEKRSARLTKSPKESTIPFTDAVIPEMEPSSNGSILQSFWTQSSGLHSPENPMKMKTLGLPAKSLSCKERRSNGRAIYVPLTLVPPSQKAPSTQPLFAAVIDEVHELQRLSPRSYISRTTIRSEEVYTAEKISLLSLEREYSAHDYVPSPDTLQQLNASSLSTELGEVHSAVSSGFPRSPIEWDAGTLIESASSIYKTQSLSSAIASDETKINELGTTHFQRFIQRLEDASPRLIIDRLGKKCSEIMDDEAREEFYLEKYVWLLTAFYLHVMRDHGSSGWGIQGYLLPESKQKRSLLELYGNIAEAYQLSAVRPGDHVHSLPTASENCLQLPENIFRHPLHKAGTTPLPFDSSSFEFIRASSLPSQVPASMIPTLLCECHRLLIPGGLLELRTIDALPCRSTMGPKMSAWLEDRLSIHLERHFRCSRPTALLPGWAKDVRFVPAQDAAEEASPIPMRLAAACDFRGEHNEREQLEVLVVRELWKETWGSFVRGARGWWWNDEQIVEECVQYNTVFKCSILLLRKA